MKNHTSEPEKYFPDGSRIPVWKRVKNILGRIFFAVIVLVFLSVIILSVKAAFYRTDQKASEDFPNNLIEKGSMIDIVPLPEAENITPGNTEANNTPENKTVLPDENTQSVAPQENNEDKPKEEAINKGPETVPIVKKDTAKKTAPAKPPAAPVKKKETRGISCKHKNDHPSYSKTKGKHMDEDCCPDPDEWPKPGCVYSEKGLALMLSGPSKKKK